MEATTTEQEHIHEFKFAYTIEDWWDGDEEDVYKCECGEIQRKYISR